jgi:hypothetical protein
MNHLNAETLTIGKTNRLAELDIKFSAHDAFLE